MIKATFTLLLFFTANTVVWSQSPSTDAAGISMRKVFGLFAQPYVPVVNALQTNDELTSLPLLSRGFDLGIRYETFEPTKTRGWGVNLSGLHRNHHIQLSSESTVRLNYASAAINPYIYRRQANVEGNKYRILRLGVRAERLIGPRLAINASSGETNNVAANTLVRPYSLYAFLDGGLIWERFANFAKKSDQSELSLSLLVPLFNQARLFRGGDPAPFTDLGLEELVGSKRDELLLCVTYTQRINSRKEISYEKMPRKMFSFIRQKKYAKDNNYLPPIATHDWPRKTFAGRFHFSASILPARDSAVTLSNDNDQSVYGLRRSIGYRFGYTLHMLNGQKNRTFDDGVLVEKKSFQMNLFLQASLGYQPLVISRPEREFSAEDILVNANVGVRAGGINFSVFGGAGYEYVLRRIDNFSERSIEFNQIPERSVSIFGGLQFAELYTLSVHYNFDITTARVNESPTFIDAVRLQLGIGL